MSADRALHLVDTLLDVLQEADKRGNNVQQEEKTENNTSTNTNQVTYEAPETDLFTSYEQISEGNLVQVTCNLDKLRKEWDAAEMGQIEDLTGYLRCIGKVVDIEDDDTVQVEWANYDSFWLPVLACRPTTSERTLPGANNSWLLDKPQDDEQKTETKDEEKVSYFTSAEDDTIQSGMTVRVTSDINYLKQCWKESDLGPDDGIDSFLGCIGKIVDIEEDDDSFQLRWENYDEVWLPVKACSNANGAKPTLPGSTVSWLN